ncbi:MAG: cytochrome c [Chitinophagales bacterium]|nr:cytochrome c [Chitinophagales bacterium]
MSKKAILLALTGTIIIISCSQKNFPQKSETKTVPVTSYAGPVKELIMAKCSPCHVAGGNKTPLDNYESTKKLADDIIRRVELNPGERGFMPMKREKLSADEIALIKKWKEEGMAE